MEDVFVATKLICLTGKIFGSVLYSVHGRPKFHYLKITFKDKIYFLIINMIIVYCTFKILYNTFDPTQYSSISFLVPFIANVFFAITATQNIFFCVIFQKNIIKMCRKIDKLFHNFNRRVLEIVKYSCYIFVLFSYGFYILFFILTMWSREDAMFTSPFSLCLFLTTTSELQTVSLLFLLKMGIKEVNDLLKRNIFSPTEKTGYQFFKHIMDMHLEICNICKNLNYIFIFLISRVISCYLLWATSCYNISFVINSSWGNVFVELFDILVDHIDIITEPIFTFLPIILIICVCTTVKNEVGIFIYLFIYTQE